MQLGYTSLTSPIAGVTGIRQVDMGNIIHPTDPNGLVVVTQIEPISLIFTLPETDLPQIQQQQQKTKAPLTVLAYSQDDTIKLDEGTLGLVNNQILQTTGSIQLKANFPNKAHRLWPGQLINVRLLLDTRHDGLTVAASVVQQGPKGALRVCHQSRQHGRDPAGHRRANQRRAGSHQLRPQGQRAGRGRRTIQAAARQRRSPFCTARRPRKPMHKARSRRRSHEHFRAVHPAADRDRSADGGIVGRRSGRLSAIAGGGAAERQLSDASGHCAAAGRRPADHGIFGGDAARIAVRPNPGPHPDDVGERARLYPDHPAVRFEPRHRRGGRATRCRRSMRRARICRWACRIRRRSGRSIRPTRRSWCSA